MAMEGTRRKNNCGINKGATKNGGAKATFSPQSDRAIETERVRPRERGRDGASERAAWTGNCREPLQFQTPSPLALPFILFAKQKTKAEQKQKKKSYI